MATIEEFLNKDSHVRVRVGVIGDAMVDEYYQVSVKRLSPEFPIPVMLSGSEAPTAAKPGGAANVAYQFKHFNSSVYLCSLVDTYSRTVFIESGLDTNLCVEMSEGRVPRKKRLYDGNFPTYRWDVERPQYGLSTSCLQEYDLALHKNTEIGFAKHGDVIGAVDVIIMSDYDKGVFKHNVWQDNLDGDIPTIVDPKGEDIDKWRGCTVFKPNSVEAAQLSGGTQWQFQCKYFIDRLHCGAVVITQGGKGVVGCVGKPCAANMFEYRPAKENLRPESVIGAGDCFMAFLAMAIGHGFSVQEAAEIAYEAGAVYVTQKHNRPITPYQMRKKMDPKKAKYVTTGFLKKVPNLVMTNGCFDILHKGHIETLKFAAEQGEHLVVALNSDESVRRLKGSERPVVGLEDRMDLIASLDFVDFVVSFDEDTPEKLIAWSSPAIIVKGGDYKVAEVVGSDVAEIRIAPTIEGLSTTGILEKANKKGPPK